MSCNPCAECPPDLNYTLPPCAEGEPCEEIFPTDCVSYKGPNLPALGIKNTDRLSDILTSLHQVVNTLINPVIPIANFTATNTGTGANPAPLIVTYLGLGPVYKSTPGATGSGTTITVGSTTGLVVGMRVEVTAGVGVFAANTTVTSIPSPTTFVVSQAPTTALSGGSTTITATGSNHDIFTISVLKNIPQTFKAFAGSPVKLSGTGTIV
jgi:hypothetical protein